MDKELTFNSLTGTSLNALNFCKLAGYFVKKAINIKTPESMGEAAGMAQVCLISNTSLLFMLVVCLFVGFSYSFGECQVMFFK